MVEENHIEELIGAQSHSAQRKIRKKLKDPKQREGTLYEMDVGTYLSQLGYKPEYEKLICRKTPDWYVPAKGGIPAFLVEVTGKHISDEEKARFRRIGKLEHLLRQIGVAATLDLDVRETTEGMEPSKVRDQVENWLTRQEPVVGERKCVSGIRFKIVRVGHGCKVDEPFITYKVWHPRVQLLRRAIKEKTCAYARFGMPLVVALAAGFITGFDWEDFEEALFGWRDKEGVFATKKSLSAAIWLPRPSDLVDRIRFYQNEQARIPLPKSILDRFLGYSPHPP